MTNRFVVTVTGNGTRTVRDTHQNKDLAVAQPLSTCGKLILEQLNKDLAQFEQRVAAGLSALTASVERAKLLSSSIQGRCLEAQGIVADAQTAVAGVRTLPAAIDQESVVATRVLANQLTIANHITSRAWFLGSITDDHLFRLQQGTNGTLMQVD